MSFADFGQVNFLLDKTTLGETGCLSNFLGSLSMSLALHPGFSDLLRSPPALSSTPTTFGCLLFLMFKHPVLDSPPFLTQSVRLHLVTYPSLCSTCLTYRTLVTKCFPPNPYLGKRRISLGVTSILSMCLHSHT